MSVVAKKTCRVGGFRQLVKEGSVFDDKDPVVRAHPELFESPEEYQRRTTRPRSTAELGARSMSARGQIETARSAPGEERDVEFPCPTRDETGCDKTFKTPGGAQSHASQVHA